MELKQIDTGGADLKESQAKKKRAAFVPQTMGVFILLIIILGFIAGVMRKEFALSLTAAVFLALWLYCLLMTLLTALILRGRAVRMTIRIRRREISAGEQAELIFSESKAAGFKDSHNTGKPSWFFRMPGILVRCRLLLRTADGRHILHDFNPASVKKRKNSGAENAAETFTANERGAYFSDYDEFAIFDILGLFRWTYRITCEAGYRLLVCPHSAIEPRIPNIQAGGTEHPSEVHLRRSDNLIDHRPYIPGDDPRRINWKLYGHGSELFVREGEREPPPHSNVLILLDTHFDSMLFTAETGRQGIDILCENALAYALELVNTGIDVFIGWTGLIETAGLIADNGQSQSGSASFMHGGSPAEIAAVFARPAAIPWLGAEQRFRAVKKLKADIDLPAPPADRGILVFALPRANADSSALNRFLNRTASEEKPRSVEVIFMFKDSGRGGVLDDAAGVCAAMYNRRPGVRAGLIKVGN